MGSNPTSRTCFKSLIIPKFSMQGTLGVISGTEVAGTLYRVLGIYRTRANLPPLTKDIISDIYGDSLGVGSRIGRRQISFEDGTYELFAKYAQKLGIKFEEKEVRDEISREKMSAEGFRKGLENQT